MELAENHKLKIKKMKRNGITLAVLIVFTICFLQGYGIWVSRMGYSNVMVQGYGEKVALAVLAIRDGIAPWKVFPAGTVETAGLSWDEYRLHHSSWLISAGFDEENAHWGLQEIMEYERMAGDERLTAEYDAEHLLQYSFLEEYLMYGDVENPVDGAAQIPQPVFAAVDDAYFADAVFIGDSRMQGVYEYAGLEEADFLAKVSMTIYNMMNTKVTTSGHNETVREALTERQYGKIYIMVGINEIGTADVEYFIRNYRAVLDEIRTLQPDALIVIQAIMHVAGDLDRKDPYFNNANINERNEALKELANGNDIFYIDVNEVYDDENGNLRQEVTADNVHLLGNCYEPWHTFFMEHGIVYESGGEE